MIVAAVFRKPPPSIVLVNKATDQSYEIPFHHQEKIFAIGEAYNYCERKRAWPEREKVAYFRRVSACADLIGLALEELSRGDTILLDEFSTLHIRDLANRIDERMKTLAQVV